MTLSGHWRSLHALYCEQRTIFWQGPEKSVVTDCTEIHTYDKKTGTLNDEATKWRFLLTFHRTCGRILYQFWAIHHWIMVWPSITVYRPKPSILKTWHPADIMWWWPRPNLIQSNCCLVTIHACNQTTNHAAKSLATWAVCSMHASTAASPLETI